MLCTVVGTHCRGVKIHCKVPDERTASSGEGCTNLFQLAGSKGGIVPIQECDVPLRQRLSDRAEERHRMAPLVEDDQGVVGACTGG